MKTLLPILLLAVFVIFTTHAEADTVFDEDFSGGEGAFSGFDTGNCNWHTPGANATFTTYFGNGEFAEITKSGCLLTSFTRALVSDEFDLSGYENAELSFNHYFTQSGAISQGQVSVSTDGGSNWTPVYTTSGGNTGTVETADLSAYDGESTVSLRFEFNYFGGILASAWGFDDVTVEADVVADDDTGDDDTGDDDTGDDDTGDDDTGDDDTGDDDTGDDDATDIAYIYSGNITRATDFETFLLGEGYDVHVYQIAELDTDLDLSDIEVFVIDPDTSADWTMTRREAVTDTGMPVITDGDGFQVLSGSGTYIAGGHFIAEQEKTGLEAFNLGHPVWHIPNDLGLTKDENDLTVLSSSNTLRALNDDGSAPLGVQFLGLADGATDNYALAFENIRYAVWTFGVFGPSLYTSEGKDLFVNVIEYVQSEPVNIAYIYDTDDTDALAYQTFLESVGYLVALFDVTEVAAKADFSEFDMFIVDNNAGESSWTSAAADVLVSSAKPVIVHNDGIFVFDETTQFLREDNTLALDPAMSVIPHMTDHAVWSEPYALELPESGPVDVLSSTATYRGLHDDGTAPGDVEFLGSDTAFLNHYPLAIQGARYALWGPGAAAPTSYTVFARELYFNLIEYLQAGEPVGDDDDDTGDDDAGDDDDDDDDDLDDDVTTGDDDDDDDDDGGCCGC